MVLLDDVYHFTPRDDKTNFMVDFEVPEGYAQLRCECNFSPKEVEDVDLSRKTIAANIGKYVARDRIATYQTEKFTLVNHLTFSLDYENVYIGCAHRHAPQAVHIISEHGSSPGFISQGAQAGTWHAVINIHSITSRDVTYCLKISAWKEALSDGI